MIYLFTIFQSTMRVYLLAGANCGDDFQPGGKFVDAFGQEGSQGVTVIWPMELGLV